MRIIKFLVVFIILVSCVELKENGINVIIENETDYELKNITFHTSEKVALLLINNIKPNRSSETFYLMKEHKMDGHYILNFTKNDTVSKSIDVGYYTNGFSLDDRVKFIIKKDTILTDFD